MRFAFYTLGCKTNQYETQAMEQELQRRGHTLVDFESPADATSSTPAPSPPSAIKNPGR